MLIILEDSNMQINKVVDKLEQSYKHSSRKVIGEKSTLYDIKQLESPPLLNNQWYVKIEEKAPLDLVDRITKLEDVYAVVVFNNQNKYSSYVEKLQKNNIEFSTYNSVKLDKREIIDYILSNLNIEERVAEKLYSKCRGIKSVIYQNMQLLKTLDRVTSKDIDEYVVKTSEVSLHYFAMSVFGMQYKYAMKYKACVKLLYKYRRNGYRFIKKYLLDELEKIMTVYMDMDLGELNMTNYRQYKKVSSNHLLDYIKLREQVSFEYIAYIQEIINGLNKDIWFIQLINLLKLNRGGVN